jgi:hypothetical protein
MNMQEEHMFSTYEHQEEHMFSTYENTGGTCSLHMNIQEEHMFSSYEYTGGTFVPYI